MDDDSKAKIQIDVERLPTPEETGSAVPIISMSNLLVLAGFCAIGLRLLGIGEDIIELGFAIGFLVFVKHYSSRLKRLEIQNSSKGRPQSVGKTIMVLGALLVGSFLLIHNERQLWYGRDEIKFLGLSLLALGPFLMVGGFLIWLKDH